MIIVDAHCDTITKIMEKGTQLLFYEIYRFCLYVFYISQPVWLYIYE